MGRFSMRSWLMTLAVGFGWAASASAADGEFFRGERAEEIFSQVDLGDTFLDEDSGWDVGGWLQAGYTNKSDGVLNTRPDALNVHQAWLFIEKVADGSDGLDWGARVDAMYGLDADNTQSYGNLPNTGWDNENSFDHGSFGFAIPQAYGVLAYDKLSVKIGHFYTPAGYEVVPANGNFFYSHALAWNFTEPFTHTGALGTYTASDDVTLYGGWVAGWDTGFAQNNGGSAFIGGATVKVLDDVSVGYITTIGNLGAIGDGNSHHFVTTVALTDKLNYALSSDINHNDTFDSISAGNYLIYSFNDKMGVGGRAEWMKFNGVSYYETTLGVNIKPVSNLIIRPEIRHQWSPGAQGGNNPLGNAAFADQSIFGIDVILTF
jgi:Putative beta-barrel porin-2, OmpL-like. bbp2